MKRVCVCVCVDSFVGLFECVPHGSLPSARLSATDENSGFGTDLYAVIFTRVMQFGVSSFIGVENAMTSLNWIHYYRNIDKEDGCFTRDESCSHIFRDYGFGCVHMSVDQRFLQFVSFSLSHCFSDLDFFRHDSRDEQLKKR